jgi:glycerol-3-phosphate dehydrogenase
MLLPGAHRLNEARAALESLDCLSGKGVERILGIYGGRAIELASLAGDEPNLMRCIDAAESVLAAEVVFSAREEWAQTLIDIVHRRLMLGLNCDQGRALYNSIATITGDEFNWNGEKRSAELDGLNAYSDSFRV